MTKIITTTKKIRHDSNMVGALHKEIKKLRALRIKMRRGGGQNVLESVLWTVIQKPLETAQNAEANS